MNMIPMNEVLTLFDRATGYGIDLFSRNALDQMNESAHGKHVTDRRTAYRIIDEYIQERYSANNRKKLRNVHQRRTILYSEGDYPDATYSKHDILRMLEDKIVQRALAQQFKNHTEILGGIYVPSVISRSHPYHPNNQPVAEPWEVWA